MINIEEDQRGHAKGRGRLVQVLVDDRYKDLEWQNKFLPKTNGQTNFSNLIFILTIPLSYRRELANKLQNKISLKIVADRKRKQL